MEGSVDLAPLVDRLCAVDRADSVLIWLRKPHAKHMLQGLAVGDIALSHQALDGLDHRQAADYLREILVAAGLLEGRDLALARYDRWLSEHLDEHFAHAPEAIRRPSATGR